MKIEHNSKDWPPVIFLLIVLFFLFLLILSPIFLSFSCSWHDKSVIRERPYVQAKCAKLHSWAAAPVNVSVDYTTKCGVHVDNQSTYRVDEDKLCRLVNQVDECMQKLGYHPLIKNCVVVVVLQPVDPSKTCNSQWQFLDLPVSEEAEEYAYKTKDMTGNCPIRWRARPHIKTVLTPPALYMWPLINIISGQEPWSTQALSSCAGVSYDSPE